MILSRAKGLHAQGHWSPKAAPWLVGSRSGTHIATMSGRGRSPPARLLVVICDGRRVLGGARQARELLGDVAANQAANGEGDGDGDRS